MGDDAFLSRLHGQTFLLPRPDGDREEEVSGHLLFIMSSYLSPSIQVVGGSRVFNRQMDETVLTNINLNLFYFLNITSLENIS